MGAEWSAASQVGVAMHRNTHAQRRRRTMSRYRAVSQICGMRLVAVRASRFGSSVYCTEPLDTRTGRGDPGRLGMELSMELSMAGARNVRSPERRLGRIGGSSGWGLELSHTASSLTVAVLQARVTVWGRLFGLLIPGWVAARLEGSSSRLMSCPCAQNIGRTSSCLAAQVVHAPCREAAASPRQALTEAAACWRQTQYQDQDMDMGAWTWTWAAADARNNLSDD